jgi:hypothetical protein
MPVRTARDSQWEPIESGGGYAPSSPQLVTGPEAIKAQDKIRRQQSRRDQWPYPWLCPSEEAKSVFVSGSILAPAVATLTEVLEYTVPSGMQFAFCGVIQSCQAAGYIPGDQDVLWTLDTDQPIGVPAPQGNPLPGLHLVPVPLGSLWPWAYAQFEKPWILKPNQVLRSKVFLPTLNPLTGALNSISAGSPNLLVSVFSGFTWPV